MSKKKLAVLAPAYPDLHKPGWPVIEVFGPTIQGEGPYAGKPCAFVRFGGCDYRCSWCDSMYAVDPEQVRENAVRMEASEIVDKLAEACAPYEVPKWIIFSGGNPALHNLGELVAALGPAHRVSVETQGSVWKPWLKGVDCLVVSPKPPSSGMASPHHEKQFKRFMYEAGWQPQLKIVVFDEEDYEWAKAVWKRYRYAPLYLSVGTPQGVPEADIGWLVGHRYRWLCEKVARDPEMNDVTVLPQLHVIAWGAARGV